MAKLVDKNKKTNRYYEMGKNIFIYKVSSNMLTINSRVTNAGYLKKYQSCKLILVD